MLANFVRDGRLSCFITVLREKAKCVNEWVKICFLSLNQC